MAEVQTEHHHAKVRYHSLDALRAWAMSMGIVLHAAWIMTPGESGAPKTDASASWVMDYLGSSIHMFRMQLFFVLAGFFACLLVRKRGTLKFSWNRTLRIGIPLVLFWLLLRPPMQTQFFAAQLQSGALQTDKSAWQLTKDAYASMTVETVFTMHLWFIYYLFLAYILVLAARAVISIFDRQSKFRETISKAFGRIFVSPWAVLPLACLTGVFMLPMDGFSGVQMDPFSLYPLWSGFLCYVTYFVVGWLIFRNVNRLSEMLRGWKWQLSAGMALTLVYFLFYHSINHRGYETWAYPALTVNDMRFDAETDEPLYAELRQQLLDAQPGTTAAAAWQLLPKENQLFLEQNESATPNQINGLLTVISTSVLADNEFTALAQKNSAGDLSAEAQEVQEMPVDDRKADQTMLLNRELFQTAFASSIWSQDKNRPYYQAIRVAYSLIYSLTTWLLIFGCIGFSQAFFNQHSRFWRYYSDASYWMYLMHLVVQFQILLWVGDQAWPWALKFSLYVFGTLAVLIPTYHFLVRPTWLGWLLNGRTYSVWGAAGTSKESSEAVKHKVTPASSPAVAPPKMLDSKRSQSTQEK